MTTPNKNTQKCTYTGCTAPPTTEDTYDLGLCKEHTKNAYKILGYKPTQK